MNNKIIIGIIIVILIVLGFFVFRGNDSGDENSEVASDNESVSNNEAEIERGEKSIRELMASGSAVKCDYSYADEGLASEGTMYASEGKMRANFTSQTDGQNIKSNMISDGEYFYTWADGSTSGFKMKVEADAAAETDTDQNQADLDQKVDYECERWSEDGSMFNPPGSVTFSDYSQMMMQPESTNSSDANDAKAMQCAACDSLTGDSKAQCLSALSCN